MHRFLWIALYLLYKRIFSNVNVKIIIGKSQGFSFWFGRLEFWLIADAFAYSTVLTSGRVSFPNVLIGNPGWRIKVSYIRSVLSLNNKRSKMKKKINHKVHKGFSKDTKSDLNNFVIFVPAWRPLWLKNNFRFCLLKLRIYKP